MEIIIAGKESNRLGPLIMLSDLEPSQSFQGYVNIPNRVRKVPLHKTLKKMSLKLQIDLAIS